MKEMTTNDEAKILTIVQILAYKEPYIHDYFWNMFRGLEDNESRHLLISNTLKLIETYGYSEETIKEKIEKYDDIINCLDNIRKALNGGYYYK